MTMEAQEVYNVPITELVTALFNIEWSEDNQISLLTERGVHIFELQPNPLCPTPTPKFRRSFLWATDYLPTEIFSPIVETVLNNCEREDMYALLFEEALTPKFPERTEHVPRIIQVAWSPVKLVEPTKCLLATVSSAGAIDMAFKVGINWYSVSNLSQIWFEIIKEEMAFDVETCTPEEIQADTFKSNLRRLQGTSVTWSGLSKDSEGTFSYLATGYRSSELVVWRISKISELSINVTPTMIYRTKFKDHGRISKLIWMSLKPQRHLILVGFFDGRMLGVQLIEDNNQLTENFIKNYEEYPDRIPINFITTRTKTTRGNIIGIAKNIHFILIEINDEGEVEEKKHVQLPGFSISSILLLNDSEAMISTQDSGLHHIKLDSTPMEKTAITHDMKCVKTQYLGMARSPSGATFVNVTSPSTTYDHLCNREPSNLQFFTLKSPEFDPWCRLEKSQSNLHVYWDCLEMIRIRSAKATDGEDLFPKIPQELDHSLSTHQLRVIMWLTLITEVVKKKKFIKKIDNVVGEISEAQPLIFVHTISNHMIKLARKKVLSDNHRLSIHFLRLYLEVFLAGEEDESNQNSHAIRHAKEAMNATSKVDLIEAEPCNLCGEIVTELPWNTSSCPRGHQLPRCALTLLQITSLKYKSCPVCGRIFHPLLDEEYEEMKCLYCDVPVVFDTRVVGIYDEVEEKGKNLSVKPIWDIPIYKRFEGEGGEKEKGNEGREEGVEGGEGKAERAVGKRESSARKRKRKRMKSPTLDAVNDTNNGILTETGANVNL
ncbi:uncharacterized protein LOC107039454 [Diachasma alloeum]|uniref:uncharacterized protein LOC107039454 n=1 Tax=Diachasma alloeum TaxID=454923 RepID=UPI00073841A9|nr:uncharacterized protein LOC107039454 [Diachasma alloeum]XP_015114555.1 uncharacterized protein LOC107039454 [Diachasma alloeum]